MIHDDNSFPRIVVPAGACDCHVHIYPPARAMLPGANIPSQSATLDEYRKVKKRLGLTRTVIVQPTAYGTDNSATLETMAALGDAARGIAVVESTVSQTEIERLDGLGMRGLRYHQLPGDEPSWHELERTALQIASFGWHMQFSLQLADQDPSSLTTRIGRLPCHTVFDHIARLKAPIALDSPDVKALRRLIDGGRCWIKLSAPYHGSRSGAPEYADIGSIAAALVRQAPERMLWASNWPHPSLKTSFPDEAVLLDLLEQWAPAAAIRENILVSNPALLYRFGEA